MPSHSPVGNVAIADIDAVGRNAQHVVEDVRDLGGKLVVAQMSLVAPDGCFDIDHRLAVIAS